MREVPLTVYTIFRAAHRNLKLVTRRQKREDSQVNQNLPRMGQKDELNQN